MTDIEIAHSIDMDEIINVANRVGINDIELYGKYKAKINSCNGDKKGKVILITATNPTPFGEGKTTVAIGLLDALCKSSNSILTLREPSLGPVFGVKGGACGGGMSQVVPMEDINLHFTGDFHAITSANNLLCAAIDNHIKQGNNLEIDKVLFNRCLDINDRELKNVTLASGRSENFNITAASEIMAIVCLAKDMNDLRNRLNRIVVGENKEGKYIYAKDLKIVGSLCVLLRDAIKPNLVQTLEHNPVIIHGGPFANIAHGCCSVIATQMAKSLCDYVVTEAGFGSDCGALKYYDIVARDNDLKPDVTVLVTSVKALEYNGIENLQAHLDILNKLNQNIIVCINKFSNDNEEDIKKIVEYCKSRNVLISICTSYNDGGNGAIDLANKVKELANKDYEYKQLYNINETIRAKIDNIVKDIYGAINISYSAEALDTIKKIEFNNLDNLKICIAKTQYSLSDDKDKIGYPKDFDVFVKKVKISNGAGFIVIYLGSILTMPGLPVNSNYEKIDIINGSVIGLS
ncbi:MAG: formate--tetrahydrofolate ligase [Bacilli bacterium]